MEHLTSTTHIEHLLSPPIEEQVAEAHVAVALIGVDGTVRGCNDRLLELLGNDQVSLIGTPFIELLEEGTRSSFSRGMHLLLTGTIRSYSTVLQFASTESLPKVGQFQWSLSRTYGASESPILLAVPHSEDLRRVGKARETQDSSELPMVGIDANLDVLYTNEALSNLIGYPASTLLGLPLLAFIDGEGRPAVRKELRKLHRGDEEVLALEVAFIKEDGSQQWVFLNFTNIGIGGESPDHMLLILDDISNRKLREKELESKASWNSDLAELFPDAVIVVSTKGIVLYGNHATAVMLEIDESNLVGLDLSTLRASSMEESASNRWTRVLSGETVIGQREQIHTTSGRLLEYEVSSAPVQHNGESAVLSVVRDLSERNRLDRELKEAREFAELTFDYSTVGQATLGLDACILRANPALEELALVPSGTLIGRSILELIHPDDREAAKAVLQHLLDEGDSIRNFQRRLVRKDGSLVWITLGVSVVRDQEGRPKHFVSHIEDITALRTRTEELVGLSETFALANQRLEELSELAQGESERYRALVDHLPETATYLFDRDHRVVTSGGGGMQARGIDPQKIIGKHLSEFSTASDFELLKHHLDQAFLDVATSYESTFETTGITCLVDVVPLHSHSDHVPNRALVVSRDISKSKAREVALTYAERRWRTAFEKAPIGIVELNEDGTIHRCNVEFARILELSVEQVTTNSLLDYVHPDDVEWFIERGLQVASGAPTNLSAEVRLVSSLGRTRTTSFRGSKLEEDNGMKRLLIHVLDITLEKEQRSMVDEANSRFTALIQNSADVILLADIKGGLTYASPAFAAMCGSEEAAQGITNLLDILHPDDRARFHDEIAYLLGTSGSTRTFDCRVRLGGDNWRHIEATVSNHLDNSAVQGFIINARDITERVEVTKQMEYRALHDVLTGLPNRANIFECLTGALVRMKSSDTSLALLFLDLDGFKAVNDTYGHGAGDTLLVRVAERLLDCVRKSDSVVGRMGGDEFVIVAEGLHALEHAITLAERIRLSISKPFKLGTHIANIGCSIGIALSSDHQPDELLNDADTALYSAKLAGKNQWKLYNSDMLPKT